MKCKKLQKAYSRYIDGQMDEQERRSVEEHIRDCPGCTAAVNSLEKLRSMLRRVDEAGAPDEYWDTYWTRLEEKLPDEPLPVTLASRVSDAFAGLLRQPAALGRAAIYIFFLAFLLYTTSDRLVKTPPMPASAPLAYDSDMRSEAPALSLERDKAEEAAGMGAVESRDLYERMPVDDAKATPVDKDAGEVRRFEGLDRLDLALKPEAPAETAVPLAEAEEKLGQAEPAAAAKPTAAAEVSAGLVRAQEEGTSKLQMDAVLNNEDEYILAEKHFEKGEYHQAIPAYQNFVISNTAANVQDDRTLKAVYQIGEAYYQMGNYSDALSNFVAVTDAASSENYAFQMETRLKESGDKAVVFSAPQGGRKADVEAENGLAFRSTTSKAVETPDRTRQRAAAELQAPQRGDALPKTRDELISRAIFRQAESYEHLNRQDEALAAYRKYIERYPQGEYAAQAREKTTQKSADPQKAKDKQAEAGETSKESK